MAGVNKVILVGNLGRDPESRSTPNGTQIVSFSIATSDNWTDKQTGQRQERTEWHNITVFDKLASICAQYLRKGSKVYVEGSLRTEKYTDKQTGAEKYSTKIIANTMQMLDSRNEGSGYQAPAQQGGYQSQAPSAPSQQQASPNQGYNNQGYNNQAPAPSPAQSFNDFDDDIPF